MSSLWRNFTYVMSSSHTQDRHLPALTTHSPKVVGQGHQKYVIVAVEWMRVLRPVSRWVVSCTVASNYFRNTAFHFRHLLPWIQVVQETVQGLWYNSATKIQQLRHSHSISAILTSTDIWPGRQCVNIRTWLINGQGGFMGINNFPLIVMQIDGPLIIDQVLLYHRPLQKLKKNCDGPNMTLFTHTLPCEKLYKFP